MTDNLVLGLRGAQVPEQWTMDHRIVSTLAKLENRCEKSQWPDGNTKALANVEHPGDPTPESETLKSGDWNNWYPAFCARLVSQLAQLGKKRKREIHRPSSVIT